MSKLTLSVTEEKGTRFPWEKKEEAVRTYLTTGNMRLTASVIGCSVQTLEYWRKQEWWNQIAASVKQGKRLALDSKLGSIVDKSLELMEDRLANGDYVLNNKTGEIVRKPVALKDLNAVATSLLTRQNVLQHEEKETEQSETIADTLQALKAEFASWARDKKRNNAETIEFKETTNAIHEEREEGLQEGSSSLHLEAGSEEEES